MSENEARYILLCKYWSNSKNSQIWTMALRCIADCQAQVPRPLIGWGLRARLAWLQRPNAAEAGLPSTAVLKEWYLLIAIVPPTKNAIVLEQCVQGAGNYGCVKASQPASGRF